MAAEDIIIKLKRGVSGGAAPTGLTHGELAINTTDVRLYVGSLTGAVVPVNNRFFEGATAPDYPITGDRWFNGQYETVYINNSWEAVGLTTGSFDPSNLLLFTAGASGSGGMTFSGNFTITNNLGGTTIIENGLSASNLFVSLGATFGSNIFAPNIVNSVNGITGAVNITSGSNITITQTDKTITISSNGGGGGSNVLATSSVTGVASFRAADFDVSSTGSVSLTASVARTNLSQTFTGLQTFGSGISANGITGTLQTKNQPNITSLGFLDLLNSAGITSTERVNITKGGISAGGGILIHSGGLSVTGGMNVTGDVTVGGILTFLSQFMVQGNTANFYGDIVVSGNSIGIPDYKYESSSGITWPSSSVPAYTVGDKWSNGSTEYTWIGNAWVEISNVVSSAPFEAIPDGSITPAKLSIGAPSWTSDGSLIVRNTVFAPTGSAPTYTTRAWVKFNGGMGTIALTGGNVSSISDNGVGWYTINFTTPLPHADYVVNASAREDSALNSSTTGPACSVSVDRNNPPTASSCRIFTRRSAGAGSTTPAAYDPDMVFFSAVI